MFKTEKKEVKRFIEPNKEMAFKKGKFNVGRVKIQVSHSDGSIVERTVVGDVKFDMIKNDFIGKVMSKEIECLNTVSEQLFKPYLLKHPTAPRYELKTPTSIEILQYEDYYVEIMVPDTFKV
jgi:hypothetical protein